MLVQDVFGHLTSTLFISKVFSLRFIDRIFGPDVAMTSFREALKHVAKSGEVWCEGARIYMNPVSKHFHLHNASKCLNYAVFFTPQYGDSFIEV